MMAQLAGTKILITGVSGQVAFPLALALAANNEVWGVARFRDKSARAELEVAGVRCAVADLATTDFSDLPSDFDYVLNFAVAKGTDTDWDRDLAANGESIALLVGHTRPRAFVHCSSTAVYQHVGPTRELLETDPLGDNHRVMFPTYSLAKISAEVVARAAAREHNVPTTIARLNVPYGDNGGWPAWHLEFLRGGHPITVHPERPNLFNPIHDDDIARTIPALIAAARVPATIVNWGGDPVSLEEWCEYIGELTGLTVQFVESEQTIGSVVINRDRMLGLLGPTQVNWREGIKRMVTNRAPELLSK
ncbi:MAG: NAD(P)-dependent oxidoreductase [Actinobacteria bacterium]|nr:NAD(P)-dependent oxidoreductase [Actinomycetota bacterium]